MDIREWIFDNILDYNNKVKTEEDVKIKVIVPFLEQLGYDESDMGYETPISVQVGTRKLPDIRADITIKVDGNVQLIIDSNFPHPKPAKIL